MIRFHSDRENFYNDTVQFIVKEKLNTLKRKGINLDEIIINHKMNPQKEHLIYLKVSNKNAHAKDKHFETAFIDVVEKIERQFK